MKHPRQTQIDYFEMLKKVVPNQRMLAEKVAALLRVELDGAYRRMRGDTNLSLPEYDKLVRHFNVSLHSSDSEKTFVFEHGGFRGPAGRVGKMFSGVMREIQQLSGDLNPRYLLASDDLPFFWHFEESVIVKFKIHYWTHAYDNLNKVTTPPFDPFAYGADFQEQIQQMRAHWHKVPTTEITSLGPLNSLIRQIRLYQKAGLFLSPSMLLELKAAMHRLIDQLERYAILGRKGEDAAAGKFDLYVSDVGVGNQVIIAKCSDYPRGYLSLNNYDYMKTVNPYFIEDHEHWFELTRDKSSLMNQMTLRIRKPWFDRLRKRVDALGVEK